VADLLQIRRGVDTLQGTNQSRLRLISSASIVKQWLPTNPLRRPGLPSCSRPPSPWFSCSWLLLRWHDQTPRRTLSLPVSATASASAVATIASSWKWCSATPKFLKTLLPSWNCCTSINNVSVSMCIDCA
jgi:hypothetical protein